MAIQVHDFGRMAASSQIHSAEINPLPNPQAESHNSPHVHASHAATNSRAANLSGTNSNARPASGGGVKPNGAASRFGNISELGVPIAVLGIVLAMITPLPSFLLDLLISANITVSVVILMVSLYITRPSEFSVFPTALLLLTLFRLALNISSSRLILIHGNTGTRAAGQVIEAFGNFVVGGNYVIGVVIFLVLIAIQYVVINHGAVRISEVTARFTLDALPGKQMSIDSDLNAGLIDEAEARKRRKKLAAEAEFYGAMDGASRFTQRDAVASILITVINIVAGFLIGVLQNGMGLTRAISTYTVLTIGDGLVTVIPALMVSVSGGLIVTRASSDQKLSAEVTTQVFSHPQPLMLAGGVLIAMSAFPGLPAIPFLALGSAVGWSGWRLRKAQPDAVEEASSAAPERAKETLDAIFRVEPLAVEVGLGLMHLLEGGSNSPLLRRIAGIRKQVASELGYLLPPVRVNDNLQLRAHEYQVLLKGAEIARFALEPNRELAINPPMDPPHAGLPAIGTESPAFAPAGPGAAAQLPGEVEIKGAHFKGLATREPAFGVPALWISAADANRARAAGYTVVDQVGVVGTHLGELVRRYCGELLSRQDTKAILDRVAEESPKVVEDLVPKLMPAATVQKVLQNLLRERVSIRDAVTILEALGDAAGMSKNPILLTEYVRQANRRNVVKPYLNTVGELPAFFVDPRIEQLMEGAIEYGEQSSHLTLPPQAVRDILDRVIRAAGSADAPSAALTTSGVRYFLRQMIESTLPNLAILSHNEIPPGVRVVSLGLIQ